MSLHLHGPDAYGQSDFHLLMLMASLTDQRLRWMAAISGRSGVPPERKKHPDITGDNGLGCSRGGVGTKIHLATDGSDLPLNIVRSLGPVRESQFALRLLDGPGVQRWHGSIKQRGHAVLADKAYPGHALRNELKRQG